jgi:hypothetical protein
MSTPAKPPSVDDWINPPSPDVEPEPGYHEWLAREIEEAIQELKEGRGIPIEEIRKEFDLD